MKTVLASTSPRRRELITKITEDFTAVPADVDEKAIEERIGKDRGAMSEAALAEKTVRELSRAKAAAAFRSLGEPADTLVIGADTVVALENEILGKPRDREDAVRMLRAQSMEPQQVMTGVTLMYRPQAGKDDLWVRTFVEKSLVFFYALDDAQEARIQAYCDTDEPYDKAGAYGIQLGGSVLVERFEGDFDNIVGFPAERIRKEIEQFLSPDCCSCCAKKDQCGGREAEGICNINK